MFKYLNEVQSIVSSVSPLWMMFAFLTESFETQCFSYEAHFLTLWFDVFDKLCLLGVLELIM